MSTQLPDRSHLSTEQRNPATLGLDAGSVSDTLRLLHEANHAVQVAMERAMPALAQLTQELVGRMRQGGRLIYIGAGTSGRLGVLDASECPPTFQSEPGQVVGLIAGGDGALRISSEGKEDEVAGGARDAGALNLTALDTVVGIAAGGTTPYVWGALAHARSCGALTGLICCVPREALIKSQLPLADADHLVCLEVGPEPLMGSTRMKSGTATKLALNAISTCAMTHLGKVWGNLMVDLRASNIKLRDRAGRLVASQTGGSREEALALLDAAGGSAKLAIVMGCQAVDRAQAEALLMQANGCLRPILGEPK